MPVFTLSTADNIRLRAAIRSERVAKERLEVETLRLRSEAAHASSLRAALLDELGDTYGFDAFDVFDFDPITCTLTQEDKAPQEQ